jgi:methyl-accepting chemotaxis protein
MAGGSTRTVERGNNGHPGRRKGIGLRVRITLPLLLPVLGLLALSGLFLAEKLATVTAMQRVGTLTELITDTSALVNELQRERGLSGGFLASKGSELREELTAQRLRTDAHLATFEARFRRLDAPGLSTPGLNGAGLNAPGLNAPGLNAPGLNARNFDGNTALADKLSAARADLAKVGDIRQQISQLAIGADGSFAYFTAANAHLLDMIGEAAAEVDAPVVARSVSLYLSFLWAKELAGQERAVGAAGFAAGRFDAARLRHLILLGEQQDLYFGIIAAAATPAQAAFMRQTVAGDAVDAVIRMRRTAAEGGLEGHLGGITGADWFKAATGRIDLKAETASTGHAARTTLYATLAAVLVLLGLITALGTIMIRAIVRPLGALIGTMQLLAAGETELTITSTDRRDEIGHMAQAMAVFRDQAVENRRLLAAQEAGRTRAEAEKRAAMHGMADTIESETSKALALVGERTAVMAATADSMSASAVRTGVSAQSAASAASQALSNAQTVASAAEQLSASIREISAQVSQSTTVVGRAVTAGDLTRAKIQQLDSKVAQIGTVADMIREIAARTNLLALNATIEAARAGDAGKGFAVVASEVKSLAMQTARSTEEITRHLTEVNAATVASVDAVARIGETITEIHAIASSIAAAVEQQGAATAEIARNVAQTARAAEAMTTRITEVSMAAEQNGRQAGQVLDGAAELAAAVGELKCTVVRVVHTSSTEVDRRHNDRRQVNLVGRLTVPGQPVHAGHVIDLSETGARIQGTPKLPAGTRGTLDLQGVGFALPFVVGNVDNDGLGLSLVLDPATAAQLKTALERVETRQAA